MDRETERIEDACINKSDQYHDRIQNLRQTLENADQMHVRVGNLFPNSKFGEIDSDFFRRMQNDSVYGLRQQTKLEDFRTNKVDGLQSTYMDHKKEDFTRDNIFLEEIRENERDFIGTEKKYMEGNSSFARKINNILDKQGLTVEEFNSLRLCDVSALSDIEKATLKTIRESVLMPEEDTLMQKVIPVGDIAKYIDGTYTQVGGYVTKAEDVSQLSTYDDIYDSLRLDYPNCAYQLNADDSLGVIRYNTSQVSKIEIPYGIEMGGRVTEAPPFTGNGFTKATNGQIIPEFKCNGYLDVEDGAQLIEISRDGKETLKAVYSKIDKMFIPVNEVER